MQHYSLLGYPVNHSLSPTLYNIWFAHYQIEATYTAIPCQSHQLQGLLAKCSLVGGNITMPLKQAILPYCDSLSPQAKQAGAVNTFKIEQGKLHGFNTDIDGFLFALSTIPVKIETALVIGTGGAAKASLVALQQLGCKVSLQGRNPIALQQLQQQFPFITPQPNPCPLSPVTYSLIVNATAVELTPQEYPFNLEELKTEVAFDLRYNPPYSAFLQRVQAPFKLNGLPMLVGQAAKSFALWTGIESDLNLVLNNDKIRTYQL